MSLSWEQPRTNPRARWFTVRDGTAVVAHSTTTSVTLPVGFGTGHTYTVTASDQPDRESPPSTAVSGYAWQPGLNPDCLRPSPMPITAAEVSASGASLSWERHPRWSDLELRVAGVSLGPVRTATSIRVGGLAPATTYGAGLYRYSPCLGTTVVIATGSFTTAAGSDTRLGAPAGLTVTGRTDTTVRLGWTAPAGPSPAKYAVYDGDTLVAVTGSTSVTVHRLYHASGHAFTVTAVDGAGNESAHTPRAVTTTEACQANPPRPLAPAATVVSPSSVRLAWTFHSAAVSYTVLDGDRVVATAAGPETMVTGLASASRHNLRVSATLPNGCGETARSTAVSVVTQAGPAGRPAAPSGLTVTTNAPAGTSTTTLALAWSGSVAPHYRVYEGASVAAESTSTAATLTVGAGTRHTYVVVAVDEAGNESAPSAPVGVQAVFLSPP
jgi:hypothetical protein